MNQVKIGKVYRHFKGNYYYIENIGLDAETMERVVIYKAIYDREDSQIFTRKEAMFLEEIDQTRKDNATRQKYRFQLVEDLEKDFTKQ